MTNCKGTWVFSCMIHEGHGGFGTMNHVNEDGATGPAGRSRYFQPLLLGQVFRPCPTMYLIDGGLTGVNERWSRSKRR